MYRMLLIDDEASKWENVDIWVELIRKKYGVDSAELAYSRSAKEGLKALEEASFDLVLLDYRLEGMYGELGTSLITKVRELQPDARIWMFTESISDEQAMDAGADDRLDPFETKDKFYNFVESKVKR